MAYAYKYTTKKKTLWRVVYADNKCKRGFATKKEAIEYGSNFETQIKTDSTIRDSNESELTFKDVAKHYLLNYKVNVQSEAFKKTDRIIKENILPYIENKDISTYKKSECIDFRLKVADMNYCTTHKNRILSTFRNIFKYAVEIYNLDSNPAIFVDNFKKTAEEKINENSRNVWTLTEFKQFIDCVDDENYKILFITLYFTGLRIAECQALTWEDIHEDYIDINKSLCKETENGVHKSKDPKTLSSFRHVPISKSLHDSLMSHKLNFMQYQNFEETWYVHGGPIPLPKETIRRKN